MNAPIKIRAHHLLCLQGFQGKGYDKEYIKNMTRLVSIIQQDSQSILLELTDNTDDFCAACPHSFGEFCAKDETADDRMKARDHAVFKKLAIKNHEINTAAYFIELANKKFITQSDAKDSCVDCEWKKDCLWFQNLKGEGD